MIKLVSNLNFNEKSNIIFVGINEKSIIKQELVEVVEKIKEKNKDFYKFKEITCYYPIDTFESLKIVFVGLGNKDKYTLTDIQTIFANVSKEINNDCIIDIDSFSILNENIEYLTEIAAETINLVKYEFNNYKTKKENNKNFDIKIYSSKDVHNAINNGIINAEATNNARTLINEPRNKMTPSILAKYAENLAERLNIDCRIYNKKEIEELGMGAFLAVNQGSKEEAKLIHLKYRNGNDKPITALIGKGLTYDSGGYSIKPKTGMAGMKGDMGGAASVLGAIEIIARKELRANIDVIIAATENLISSEAIVPDDVVVTMSGKTIEILNTDAEGRLTLVDAVTFAIKHDAKRIIDVATLTGGVVTALGTEITGIFTNNKEILGEVKEASEKVGEMVWELPIDPFRDRCKKSDVADYNNSPGGDGHASFAAALIAEFAEDTPWVHLDIAGTSDKKTSHLLGPSGGTGVMVRTIAKLFEE